MKLASLAFLALATAAAGDQYTVDSLKKIMQATQDYHNSLSEWDGSYMGGIKMWRKSVNLVNDLNAIGSHPKARHLETEGQKQDDKLDQEGFEVAHNLVDEIKGAVDTAISIKHKYAAIPVLGKKIALRNLNNIRDASANLGTVFGPKAAHVRMQESKDIVQQIDQEFARAIQALKDDGSGTPTN